MSVAQQCVFDFLLHVKHFQILLILIKKNMDGSTLAGLLQESSRVQVKTHMKRRKNPRRNLYKIFLGGDVKIHCKYNITDLLASVYIHSSSSANIP